MLYKMIIPVVLFIVTLLWVKPWKSRLELPKIIYLLMIDAFSFSIGFNLNYYKIFSILGVGNLRLTIIEKRIVLSLLVFTFASGLFFIFIHPELRDPLSDSFINLPIVRIFRNQFTLITSFIFGYFLFLEIKKPNSFEGILKTLEIVGVIISLGIIVEVIFQINLFSIATGATPIRYGIEYLRAKGVSYEPRGAGQVLSGCILAVVYYSNPKKFIPLIILFCIAILYTSSFSGILMSSFLTGIILLRSIIIKDLKYIVRSIVAIIILSIGISISMQKGVLPENIKLRSYVYKKVESTVQVHENKIINRLEVFDAAYLNFLIHEPIFILTGTGSGMAGFASQKYILSKDKGDFPLGSTAAPLMGCIFLLSQFGIVISLGMVLIAIRGLILTKDNKKFFLLLLIILFLLQYYYYFVFFIAILFFQIDQMKKNNFETNRDLIS